MPVWERPKRVHSLVNFQEQISAGEGTAMSRQEATDFASLIDGMSVSELERFMDLLIEHQLLPPAPCPANLACDHPKVRDTSS